MEVPEVDADIARARWLPAAFYGRDDVFAADRDRVFPRSWQAVEAPGAEANQLRPFALLPGLLDESLLWAVDGQGTARLLSNVCTHRGAVLCDSARRAVSGFACPYHGRIFELDGRCRDHAGMGRPREPDWDLPTLSGRDHLRRLGPVQFLRLVPGEGVGRAALEAVQARVGPWLDRPHEEDPDGRVVYEVDANWALYVENYLEGFHLRWVHPTLSRQLDASAYRYALFDGGSVQVGASPGGDGDFDLPAGHPDAGVAVNAWYVHLFPNTFVNVYRWGVSLNVVEPTAPSRCRVRYRRYVCDPSALGEGPGSALHEVELEDDAIVARVARGLRSRLAPRGQYSLVHERAVHHFHRMYAAALGSP